MSNCTQTLLMVNIAKKQQVLDKIQQMFLTASPYTMDNWGLYPTHSNYISPDKECIRIGSVETSSTFMVSASHPNYPPKWYVEFAKEIEAKLLFQDLDGYGETITWDIAGQERMSNFTYTIEMMMYYNKTIPFTREFLGLPEFELLRCSV